MRRGGLATHHRRENNTTGGARQTHHALSMAEKHDRWGAADSPRTIDERIIRRVGRGEIAMHHRWEKNTTVGRGESAMQNRRENNKTSGGGGAHQWKVTEKSRLMLT